MKSQLLYIVALALLTSAACQKTSPCGDLIDKYVMIPGDQLDVVPYKAGDTLKFWSSNGAEFKGVCGSVQQGFEIKRGEGPCAPTFRLESRLFAENGPVKMNCYMADAGDKEATFQVVPAKKSTGYFSFISSDLHPSICKDSVVIGSKMYHGVRTLLTGEKKYWDDPIPFDTMLYNKTHGVLKIIFFDGETWERIP